MSEKRPDFNFFISYTYRKRFGFLGTACISGTAKEMKAFYLCEIDEILDFVKSQIPKKYTKSIVIMYWKEW